MNKIEKLANGALLTHVSHNTHFWLDHEDTAGITAAAGTRLALQLFLGKGFKVFSFRLPGLG